jgi:hypothetical protein
MGAFLVVIAALLIAVMVAILPMTGSEPLVVEGNLNRPSAQAVAGNMVQYHLAAIEFVSNSANRNPASTTWSFSDADQRTVRCNSSAYVAGTYSSCTTEFRPPGFLPPSTFASGSLNIVNWTVYYKDATTDIVVTYASSTSSVGGYAPAQIARALDDYKLATTYSRWYWGVVGATTTLTLDTPTSLSMPAGYGGGDGVVALATVIP